MTDDHTTTEQQSPPRLAAHVARVNERAGRNLPAAIAVAVGLLGYIVVTLVLWRPGFLLLLGAAVVLGTIELHRALRVNAATTTAVVPICIGAVGMVSGAYLAPQSGSAVSATTVLVIALGLTVVAALAWRLPGGQEGFVRDAAASMLTIAYLPLLGSFVALMLASPDSAAWITTYILCVVASDIGGFAFGVLFGRTPLAPRISPKKTVEGSAGSLLLAVVVGGLLAHFVLQVPLWVGVVFGAAMTVTATFGDLVESLVKRDLGIKDMSHFIPGHGGILDRIDSLLFSAPVAWVLLYLLVTHV